MDKLLACPFCGESPESVTYGDCLIVSCRNHSCDFVNEGLIVQLWNTRATDPRLFGLLIEIEGYKTADKYGSRRIPVSKAYDNSIEAIYSLFPELKERNK